MGKQSRGMVVIAGPTGSGKSELALRLGEAFAGTVINADSMQVYRELRILTARPDAAAEVRLPHRLYGMQPAAEPFSAALWRDAAMGEIAAARAAGRLPIVVGGTGLYLRVLLHGLAPVPEVPEAVRTAVRARWGGAGAAALHQVLAARDPVMAARLRPTDTQRLIRALEVLEATGRSLAHWQEEPPAGPLPAGPVLTILLAPPREVLYARCDRRFRGMVEAGALTEVAALLARGLPGHLPVMKALGVAELARHLADEITLDEAVAAAQQATRRYAKRQMTWFRHQLRVDLYAQSSESFNHQYFSFIRHFLLTGPS